MNSLRAVTAGTCCWLSCGLAYPAEIAQGKKTFESQCASCHTTGDGVFARRSATQIEIAVENIKAGKTRHPATITLTEDDLADLARYLVGVRSK
jgi:mono/diheme cytochrome c family protein